MTTLEIIKDLCKKRGITVQQLEAELGEKRTSIASATSNMKAEKLYKIAKYFNVSMESIIGKEDVKTSEENDKESTSGKKYYFSDETAEMAQELFENSEMRVLFDVQKDMEPEDMKAMYNMALALKRKERGTDET